MSLDNLSETLKKGFRVTLGATASMLEAIQDPQGASQKFSEIGSDFDRLTEEFETKGESTEQEARQFVDSMMTQMPNPFQPSGGDMATRTVNTTAVPVADPSVTLELKALTQEIAQIRQEIEALKQNDG